MKNEYEEGGMRITDVECLDRSLKLRQYLRAQKSKHVISEIQKMTLGENGELAQEYDKITDIEKVAQSAKNSLNIIIDHNRELYKKLEQEEFETNKNLIDEVASINLKTYLNRKKKVLASCILKSITKMGIETLGELVEGYEHEIDVNKNKSMKIILHSFPKHLVEIAKCFNEMTNGNKESLKYIQLNTTTRTSIDIITTKELQLTLKQAMNRLESANFVERLDVDTFDATNIIKFRQRCKNAKLRNIYFRLIHNDFYTHSRMKRFKMTSSDKCPRCMATETTRHLFWECSHSNHIWNLFNNLMYKNNKKEDLITSYDKIFTAGSNEVVNIIKISIIKEIIQIDRPVNWKKENLDLLVQNIYKIDTYYAKKEQTKSDNKWENFKDSSNNN
jgi:hypothetical protein